MCIGHFGRDLDLWNSCARARTCASHWLGCLDIVGCSSFAFSLSSNVIPVRVCACVIQARLNDSNLEWHPIYCKKCEQIVFSRRMDLWTLLHECWLIDKSFVAVSSYVTWMKRESFISLWKRNEFVDEVSFKHDRFFFFFFAFSFFQLLSWLGSLSDCMLQLVFFFFCSFRKKQQQLRRRKLSRLAGFYLCCLLLEDCRFALWKKEKEDAERNHHTATGTMRQPK